MTTFEENFRKDFEQALEKVRLLYKLNKNPATLEAIKEAENAMVEEESLNIYLAFLHLKDHIEDEL